MPAWGRYEDLRPRQVEAILKEAPVAYLPWGSLEWHSYHNPIGLDALKVHGLCMMAAEQTGGVVWPPIFAGYQTMKPHANYRLLRYFLRTLTDLDRLPFLDEVRSRPDVRVFTVTAENRDRLVDEVAAAVRSALTRWRGRV